MEGGAVLSLLFTNSLVGQHGVDHLQHIGFTHMGVLFAEDQHTLLLLARGDPGGQGRGLVGVARACKVAQIGHHLLAERVVLILRGPAAAALHIGLPEFAGFFHGAGQYAAKTLISQGESLQDAVNAPRQYDRQDRTPTEG